MKLKFVTSSIVFLVAAAAAAEGPKQLKPGWNMFSKEQDIQLGKEAAAAIEKQYTIVRDAALTNYVQRIGQKLAATPEAGGFPYTFQVVADKSINAFALPGGPAFVHTGLLAAADNEAQMAGVLAHEIAHVALRHGTSQASKANLIQLPALLAAGMLGNSGSMLGQLSQLGIGLGANSVLLKFSRTAESDADLLGARIMAKAGYNPLEMARFFEKLEASGGSRGPQFLSDHPNPGNRVKAVEAEVRYLPRANYVSGNPNEFARMQRLAAAVPVPPPKQEGSGQGGAAPSGATVPRIQISRKMRQHRGASFSISYPDNWQVATSQNSQAVNLAPKEGYVQSGQNVAIGVGAVVDFARATGDLRADTETLLQQLISSNPEMQIRSASRSVRVDSQPALMTTLQSRSPFAGEIEIDTVVTVERPEGLFFVVLIAPQSMLRDMEQNVFEGMLRSIRFTSR